MVAIMLASLLDWRNDPAVEVIIVDHMQGTRGFSPLDNGELTFLED